MTVNKLTGAASHDPVEWQTIDWSKAHRNVRRLQARIVKAVQEGRWGKAKALQRLLPHSFSAKALAVKRVTENKGKRTPGVDGEVWNTPAKKAAAIGILQRKGYQPQPLRRTYILKSDGKRKRPLSIPTMKDRAMQALYLLALDPIAEYLADPNSYGFRKERCQADAITQCFLILAKKGRAEWVYEGDIAACFDRISHDWLLKNIPMDKTTLHQWLKGVYLVECGTHAIVDAGFWPYHTSERVGGFRLMRSVKPGMLVMWDRGFDDYDMLAQFRQRGAHVLSRLPAHVKPAVVQPLADGSYLAYLQPSDYHRRKQGERLLVRVIEYTITDPNLPGYGQIHRLVTTLLDPEQYPIRELICAYHDRWEVEITIDEIDTHQRLLPGPLRSLKPVGVIQEL